MDDLGSYSKKNLEEEEEDTSYLHSERNSSVAEEEEDLEYSRCSGLWKIDFKKELERLENS